MGFLGGLAYPHANESILNVLVSPVGGDTPVVLVLHDGLHPMGNAYAGIVSDVSSIPQVAAIRDVQRADVLRATAAAAVFASGGLGNATTSRVGGVGGRRMVEMVHQQGTMRPLHDTGDDTSASSSASASASSSASASASSSDSGSASSDSSNSGVFLSRWEAGGGFLGMLGRTLGRGMGAVGGMVGSPPAAGSSGGTGGGGSETAGGKERVGSAQFVTSAQWKAFIRVCAMLFAIGIIGFGIPLYAIMMRYNLVVSQVCSPWGALCVGNLSPWFIAWTMYQVHAIIARITPISTTHQHHSPVPTPIHNSIAEQSNKQTRNPACTLTHSNKCIAYSCTHFLVLAF
jgi:hypothetical protein